MDSSITTAVKKNLGISEIENILTRAVYQVLNKNNPHSDVYNNLERTHNIQPDPRNQLRLIAERHCKRVERMYDKKLHERREMDRIHTDNKIKQIREEYEDELKEYKKRLEKEKNILEQTVRDRERDLQQRSDIRLMAKENDFEIRWKFLENRGTELNLLKEQLEIASEGFKKKMKAELESIRIEWEKLSAMKSDLEGTSSPISNVQIPIFKERIIELEKHCEDLKNQLSSKEAEGFILKQKLEMKGEHGNHTADIERLIMENRELKKEIQKYTKLYEGVEVDLKKNIVQSKLTTEALQFKVNEQKMIIGLLNEKVKSLSLEKHSHNRSFIASPLQTGKKNRRHRHVNSSFDSDISEFSVGGTADSNEIEKIKKRIQNLDNIAKELDMSVEHYTLKRVGIVGSHESLLVSHDGYDDYCRQSSSQTSPEKARFPTAKQPVVEKEVKEEKIKIDEPKKNVTPPPVNTQEDDYYSGIDPVMAQYMRLVGEKRNEDEAKNTIEKESRQHNSLEPEEVRQADEVVGLEYNNDLDNDIDW
ncbi:unnamed protein product [Auanema sp. JU1783]|nr:unnamed protein product [Auanema sp. JU1783]